MVGPSPNRCNKGLDGRRDGRRGGQGGPHGADCRVSADPDSDPEGGREGEESALVHTRTALHTAAATHAKKKEGGRIKELKRGERGFLALM